MKPLLIFLLLYNSFLYAQHLEGKFSRDGTLVNEPKSTSKFTCPFKKNKTFKILDYVRNNWWKINYNGCIGYVKTNYIKIDPILKKYQDDRTEHYYQKYLNQLDSIKKEKDSLQKINEKNAKLTKLRRAYVKVYNEVPPKKYDIIELDSLIKVKENQNQKDKEKFYRKVDSLKRTYDIADSIKKAEYTTKKCQFVINEIDAFTKKRRIKTEYYSLSGEKDPDVINVRFMKYGSLKYIIFDSASDLGCANPYNIDKSSVLVKLENGDIVKFYHFGDLDCITPTTIYGTLTPNDILRLKKSPIKAIRITGSKYYHDYDNIVFKDVFIKKLDCIK